MNRKSIILCSAFLSLLCQAAGAQEHKQFLEDYFLGGQTEQIRIQRDIDEFILTREAGQRAVLLSRCTNFRKLDNRVDFDAYSEELQKIYLAQDATINALNGFTILPLAAAQNEFSDDEIKLVKMLRSKPEYADVMSYVWFEHGMRQLSEGLIDVNTGVKQPWVAARALRYLKEHKLYPLFLTTLNATEKGLLSQDVLSSLQPAATAKEAKYTEALSQLFEKKREDKALLYALPSVTAFYVTAMQKGICPEDKRANGMLRLLGDMSVGNICKSSNKQNCVSDQWFQQTQSKFEIAKLAQFDIAMTLLNEKYASLCEKAVSPVPDK